jgi:PAS domain S-box-containing protein
MPRDAAIPVLDSPAIRAVDRRWAHRSLMIADACGAILIAIAACVGVGWVARSSLLTTVIPGTTPMNPLGAVAFAFAGASLWMMAQIGAGPGWRARGIAQALAITVVFIGVQRLLAYGLRWPTALDELILKDVVEGDRIAPNTAGCLVMVGFALATLDVELGGGRRHWRPAVWLAIIPGVVGLLAAAGYIYGVKSFYGVRGYVEMAVGTAVGFVILTVGILCARPEKEPMRTLVSRTVGGSTTRRLLPVAVVLPLLLGYLCLKGQKWAFYSAEFGVAMFAVTVAAVFVVVVYLSGRSLARAEIRRTQTEQMLATSEAFYHSLVETLPQNIFRKDLQGRFTFANSRFCGEIGKPLDEILGKSDFDFFPRQLAERYRRDDQNVVTSGVPFETVEEHVTPAGETLYVQVIKTAVYDESGKVIGTQGLFWDVTEKYRYERRLEETNVQLEHLAKSEKDAYEQLKQAQSTMVQTEKLAGLGQMVAGVAHEINNPLAFVSNNVAVIQRDVSSLVELIGLLREGEDSLGQELRDRVKDLEERIDLPYTLDNLQGLFGRTREGVRRIQQIVRDLRDFARLDEADLHEIDLNAGIESTVNIIQGHAKKKRVSVKTDLTPLPPVTCYPAKVNQVVMNLVGNAIDASSEGGEVCVRSRLDGNSNMVVVEVEDRGCGIPETIKNRIFDPFFTTKPPGEGTGLGLSISYGIVRDHGGNIDVQSEVGKGTRFTIRLPVVAAIRDAKTNE